MQLQKRFDSQVVVLTLNVDLDVVGTLGEETAATIDQTLDQLGIDCRNFISSTPMESVLEEYELFGLPAVILFDRSGQLLKKFDGEVDVAGQIVPSIQGAH